MAKKIRVSDDAGVTWYTLPGNSGEFANEAGEIDDTVFGQDFKSSQTGMINWTVQANGLYKGFAGYVAKVKKTGAPTILTDEATTLVSGKTYQITDATKRVLDPATAVVVEVANVPVAAADILNIDYLFGKVTFAAGYTPASAPTISGKYLPVSQVASAQGFTLTQTADTIDETDFETAQTNNGHRVYNYGLKTVQLTLNGFYKATNGWRQALIDRSTLMIEIGPDGSDLSVARGFFKPMSDSQSGDVGDLETEAVKFNLSVPDVQQMAFPFTWVHAAGSTLNVGIQKLLAAWLNSTIVSVQYLPDGVTGVEGDAVITDLTLAGGLDVMNEFTVNVQGTGALTAV